MKIRMITGNICARSLSFEEGCIRSGWNFYRGGSKWIEKYLMKKLDISAKEVFQSLTPLDMKYVYQLTDHIPKEEKKRGSYQPFTPAVNRDLIPGESVTKQVLQGTSCCHFLSKH